MTKLLINESPLQVLPTLAITIGLNEAIILQQIHYWLNPDYNKNYKDGRHWVYNSLDAWHQQFPFWSVDTLKRTFNSLIQQRLIIRENLNANKFTRTPWYSINYDALELLEEQSNTETKTLANPHGCRKVQNALIEECKMHLSKSANCPDRGRQNAQIEQCKMPSSYIEAETNTEINQESSVYSNNTHTDEKSDLKTDQTRKSADLAIAQKMLKTYADYVNEGKKISLYPERVEQLLSVLENQLNKDLKLWEQVCKNVASSALLMGEKNEQGYKTHLNWVLDEYHVTQILEGAYGVGDRKVLKKLPNETESDLLSEIEKLVEPTVMKDLRKWMLTHYGVIEYKAWLSLLSFGECDETKLVLRVPSKFMQEYISVNFMYDVQKYFENSCDKKMRVILEVAPQNITTTVENLT